MSKHNLSQAEKRTIRNEIKGEIEIALSGNHERGTAVTSRGDYIKFRIESIGGTKFIYIGGYVMGGTRDLERAAKESASAAMLALGYTRY